MSHGTKKIADYDQNLDFPDCNRVATVREKSRKFKSLSESGKSQGILLQVRDFCNLLSKSGKSQGISSVVPIRA